jgi:predicted heme/steroid binding protein
VRATDEAGNTSEITITVNVGERDTEPPCIDWAPTEIYAMSGSQVFIDIPVVDNVDDLVATLTWSDGAIDASGRLCVGEHTLTVTATDLSGNTDELVIAVHVLETRPVVGELIEDSSDK